MNLFIDKKFRLPRVWSNQELARFAPLFRGDVINVSAWQDSDKQGRRYRDYFTHADSYTLSNFKAEARGYQGLEDEIFLDLEQPLPPNLAGQFDVVFNHTVLEHIYDFQTALGNLCDLTRDVLILCVPFLQQMHGEYGDYWRFTPLAIKRLIESNGLHLLYLSFNSHSKTSVYLFIIASKQPGKWVAQVQNEFTYIDPLPAMDGFDAFAGCHALPNTAYTLRKIFQLFFKMPKRIWRRLRRPKQLT